MSLVTFMDEFDLEHSILEERTEKFGSLELPLGRRVLILSIGAALIIGGIFSARILFLSSWKGDFYKARAEMNVAKSLTIPAIRGSIYDRFGNLLAGNESSYRLVLNAGLVKREEINLDEIFAELGKILAIEKSDLQSIIEKANFEKSALVTLARDISPWQADLIKKLNNPAIEIHDDYRREYARGPAFSHALGYTGLTEFDDLAGKVGLEKYYDGILGGKDGVRLIYKDARGNILEEKLLEAPKHGADIYTTIDSGLQEYFYVRLQQALWSLGRTNGVGIALNPRNGEVLALVSMPSYDNNVFTEASRSKERGYLLSAPSKPLFNRAVSGIYAPGSTIKPLVALAALNEGVIVPEKQIFSAGFIEIPNPYFPDKPSIFLDWKPHGWVDLYSALARSSNVYFYTIGGGFGDVKGLGVEKLKEYWERFGFGSKTGIDLTAENIGFLPTPEEKEERTGDIWRLGDTYNVAIGQGDLLMTPIQLVSYISAIANGGILYKPHLLKTNLLDIRCPEVENFNIKDIGCPYIEGQKQREVEILKDLSSLNGFIKEVQKGMEDAVSKWYGTAYSLADLPVVAAAKTGSAQISGNTKTNAFFVGYAPAENPEIVILVLIEDAREGSLNAVPVAKDVLNWYYWNRLVISN